MLSIIIITCNRQDEILIAIKSCVDHITINFEVIIVDNASTDNTEAMVKSLSERLNFKLNYTKLKTNTGVSYARNIGYRVAKGEILYFIDDDAYIVSEGNSLNDAYNYMINNKEVYAMGSKSFDKRFDDYWKFTRSKEDENIVRGYVGFNHFIRKGFTSDDYLYPDNLFYGSEELYVGLNVYKNGGEVRYFPFHEVIHKPSTNIRKSDRVNKENGHINTHVIKSYFLRGVFEFISEVLFFLRILRFNSLNLKEVLRCYKLRNQRINKKYTKKLSYIQTIKLIRMFGVKAIL